MLTGLSFDTIPKTWVVAAILLAIVSAAAIVILIILGRTKNKDAVADRTLETDSGEESTLRLPINPQENPALQRNGESQFVIEYEITFVHTDEQIP